MEAQSGIKLPKSETLLDSADYDYMATINMALKLYRGNAIARASTKDWKPEQIIDIRRRLPGAMAHFSQDIGIFKAELERAIFQKKKEFARLKLHYRRNGDAEMELTKMSLEDAESRALQDISEYEAAVAKWSAVVRNATGLWEALKEMGKSLAMDVRIIEGEKKDTT